MNIAKDHFEFETASDQITELTEALQNNETRTEDSPEIEAWALQTSDDIFIDVFD